jgi:hypothetical protein
MLPDKIKAALLKAIGEMSEFQGMQPADGEPIANISVTVDGLSYRIEFNLPIPGITFAGA